MDATILLQMISEKSLSEMSPIQLDRKLDCFYVVHAYCFDDDCKDVFSILFLFAAHVHKSIYIWWFTKGDDPHLRIRKVFRCKFVLVCVNALL